MKWLRTFGILLFMGSCCHAPEAAEAPSADVGESIYRRGVVASGAPLQGTRQVGSLGLVGADAACVNCHRRSGLGSHEGTLTIPPVTGEYLFRARGTAAQEPMLHAFGNTLGHRDPYTDATLARAIREGLDSGGRPLNPLMPRFALDDASMGDLIGYLKKLGTGPMRGVTATVLHFATVVTPDADPAKRQGTLDVLKAYSIEKNSVPFAPPTQRRGGGKIPDGTSLSLAQRHWQLHLWELTGPAAGWREQLEQDFAREPVMALLSGVGGAMWGPVHDFCESAQLPCLFPNVEVPTVADGDFYSLYFSKGVLLEAGLIARQVIASLNGKAGGTVLQIYRAGDSGEAATKALAEALQGRGIELRSKMLPANRPGTGLGQALHGAASTDALVLWLRAADLTQLGEAPAALPAVFLSGLMGGLEQAPLPASWRARARMTYPVDLPDRRVVRVDYPLGWFSLRRIPVVALQTQADTYLACGILTETLGHAGGVTDPNYLVELMQESLDHRILTGYYPRLTLATGQTLASKGGYLVRFADPTGPKLVADGDWTVP
ncbi:MAG TPA: hypothetical protein VK793_04585 [Steroidobacteraceae bacterium]|nr:hypothetical protein [Steroidobacteraceae bacterium]